MREDLGYNITLGKYMKSCFIYMIEHNMTTRYFIQHYIITEWAVGCCSCWAIIFIVFGAFFLFSGSVDFIILWYATIIIGIIFAVAAGMGCCIHFFFFRNSDRDRDRDRHHHLHYHHDNSLFPHPSPP